jgi:hypothetical protein
VHSNEALKLSRRFAPRSLTPARYRAERTRLFGEERMRVFWTVVQVATIVFATFLLVATARGAVAMPLAFLLAVPGVIIFRLAWKRLPRRMERGNSR